MGMVRRFRRGELRAPRDANRGVVNQFMFHNSSSMIKVRSAFTLLELLVVIAIMGLLGAASVGGYRAMQRGMEERGVMDNVNQFIRTAFQRAQIDRQPVAVYFWNETIRGEDNNSDQPLLAVGKAVAVRRYGRATFVDGDRIGDEFADLQSSLLRDSEGREMDDEDDSEAEDGGIYLYNMSEGGDSPMNTRTLVSKYTVRCKDSYDNLIQGKTTHFNTNLDTSSLQDLEVNEEVQMDLCAYRILPGSSGPDWKIGDAYGFEFAHIELPANYIFGKSFSKNTSNPIDGEKMIRFKVLANSGNGVSGSTGSDSQIEVCAIRQIGGDLTAKTIDTTKKPTEDRN